MQEQTPANRVFMWKLEGKRPLKIQDVRARGLQNYMLMF
jgi:hypothetical protein